MQTNYSCQFSGGSLTVNGEPVLASIPETVSLAAGEAGGGLFLRFQAPASAARHIFSLGNLVGVQRFTCCFRYEPYWMRAMAAQRGGQVPVETQFLLAERPDGSCILFVPLLDGSFRASMQGQGEDGLALVVESGDPAVTADRFTGLFVAAGADPYPFLANSARIMMGWMQTGRLRSEKILPAFVDQFGWCTWDAFYQEVSHEAVREGLESFRVGGVSPRLLILDDGWQSVKEMPGGERQLTSFSANSKFSGDLTPTVQMAKSEYGVDTFLVWHAICGYWGGTDGTSFAEYDIRPNIRSFSPGILHYQPNHNQKWGAIVGVISPVSVYRFFQDYYRRLRLQGVDGVKADDQAILEGVSAGFGGRVHLMQLYHEAIEGGVQTQLKGNLINCMSLSNEMLYSALNSNLTRTSTDFWPSRPETHSRHLYDNAQVGAWFGEFVQPDWDMFQSGHPMGAFHAAGRAVSGGPVYVSDKPGGQDFAILRKLVLPDGSLLRARLPGRPTRDCLFHDPTQEPVLLKIFNLNERAGVLGAFNVQYHPNEGQATQLAGAIAPADVSGLEGDEFIVCAHSNGKIRKMGREETWEIFLTPHEFEIFTIIPIEQGVAPIGLIDLYNSSGAVVQKGTQGASGYQMLARGEGRFWVWSLKPPVSLEINDEPVEFAYDPLTCLLEFHLPGGGLKKINLLLG